MRRVAEELAGLIKSHQHITKKYIARVRGRFPEEPLIVDQPILLTSHKTNIRKVVPKAAALMPPQTSEERKQTEEGAKDQCNQATKPKKGKQKGKQKAPSTGKASAKEAVTQFERLRYDEASNTSLVWAIPKTGRTHQIRVHLQWLGHPIANDPLYANDERISAACVVGEGEEEDVEEVRLRRAKEDGEATECGQCHMRDIYRDPTEEENCLWLHAHCYECQQDPKWVYTTELPSWALE